MKKMWELNADDTWTSHFDKIGRWWNNNTEIDMITLDHEEGHAVFGECKYWKNKVGIDILRHLKQKTEQVGWNKAVRENHFILFAVNGFMNELTALAKVRKDLILMSIYGK